MDRVSLAIDVTPEDRDMLIGTDLPGGKREDAEVTLSDHVLTLSGERKQEHECKGAC